ncbi:MAG: tetratricopeptide repeat protein [Elusimicrobia bacterium]|nr:tetratricopeptide repeat protein [Candidatus Obscuribacterium magneticum]
MKTKVLVRHTGGSRYPGDAKGVIPECLNRGSIKFWIPAFAGMTKGWIPASAGMTLSSVGTRVMTILLVAVVLIAGSGSLLSASVSQDQFEQANTAFEQGDADRALDIDKTLIQKGFGGTALYYNLGNLYYRRGERGAAILWYERAHRLSPRDTDITFNLALARSHLKDEKESLLENVILYLTGHELCIGLTILLWVFFILLGLIKLEKVQGGTWPEMTIWISGLLLFLCSTWLGARIYFANQPYAIITQAPGEVRNGPGEDYAVGFTVPEGSKVLIMSQRPDWTQIGVPQQGLKGWIKSTDVDAIAVKMASSS